MKIPAIKALIDRYNLDTLRKAENDILEGEPMDIIVDGEDEGEQLTHILAAIWIMHEMEKGTEFKQALREYTQKVRKSIS